MRIVTVSRYNRLKKQETNGNRNNKRKILEAAKGCSDAKRVLKTLFPEVFEEDKYFDLTKVKPFMFSEFESKSAGFKNEYFLSRRINGEYANKAFYLDDAYNWEIVMDEEGILCLVLTKKN